MTSNCTHFPANNFILCGWKMVFMYIYHFINFAFILCVWMFCIQFMFLVPGEVKEGMETLELELQTIMTHFMGPRTQTWVLWKSSQCSWLLGHLSSPTFPLTTPLLMNTSSFLSNGVPCTQAGFELPVPLRTTLNTLFMCSCMQCWRSNLELGAR